MNMENISSIANMASRGTASATASDVDNFNKLWDIIGGMNANQISANEQMQNVLLGKSDDASGALIALEKNEQALSYATVVRDKIIEGTKKILDMQL